LEEEEGREEKKGKKHTNLADDLKDYGFNSSKIKLKVHPHPPTTPPSKNG